MTFRWLLPSSNVFLLWRTRTTVLIKLFAVFLGKKSDICIIFTRERPCNLSRHMVFVDECCFSKEESFDQERQISTDLRLRCLNWLHFIKLKYALWFGCHFPVCLKCNDTEIVFYEHSPMSTLVELVIYKILSSLCNLGVRLREL